MYTLYFRFWKMLILNISTVSCVSFLCFLHFQRGVFKHSPELLVTFCWHPLKTSVYRPPFLETPQWLCRCTEIEGCCHAGLNYIIASLWSLCFCFCLVTSLRKKKWPFSHHVSLLIHEGLKTFLVINNNSSNDNKHDTF